MTQQLYKIHQAIQLHKEYADLELAYKQEGLPLESELAKVVIDLLNGGTFSGQSILTCVELVISILHDIINIHRAKKKAQQGQSSSTTSTDL